MMPPFGPNWFGALQDPDNPIGALRMFWILLNLSEDKRLSRDEKQDEIEYFGFFANPSVYKVVRDQRNENATQASSSMRIERDYSDYDRRLKLAIEGNPEIHEQRVDIAELVATKRKEADERVLKSDKRIHTIPSDDDYGDSLIIERSPKNV